MDAVSALAQAVTPLELSPWMMWQPPAAFQVTPLSLGSAAALEAALGGGLADELPSAGGAARARYALALNENGVRTYIPTYLPVPYTKSTLPTNHP